MDSNTVGTLIFIIIVAIIFSFLLGYFFARTRAENRFFNAQTKLTKMRMDMLFNEKENLKNIKAVNVKMNDEEIKEFLKFLDNVAKEEEEEENDGE